MRFKTGDKVEFIYRNKRSEGVINGVYPETQEVSVKQSDSPIDLLFSDKAVAKVEEPELVVVPQCVDDWFIFCTSVGYDLANALYIVKGHMPVAIYEWLQNNNDNQELLARAWMDGYEVEKEPKCESEKLYIIEIDKNYMFSRIWIRSFETIAKELQYTIAHSKEESLSGDKLSMTTFACFLATHNSRHTYTVVPFNDSEGEA
ncbi:DUF1642 domain-containing protein [Listeria monocytogenes]|nr:DUF1642 domain-containing protein [Listeria monocytogenes]EEO3625724.1 DUF1642 domain-containing protein [Listeria monocytogenes]EEO6190166.1 DUF1642 domain-containing protein [Listeria monocytogenes]EEO6198441.1 DUF1642 domain-containing protein [Listeria monocytogenes]EIS3099017.1 DUF1642 domain-containing protein [Listeria monocytogenes]